MATPVTLVDDQSPSGKAFGAVGNPLFTTESLGGAAVSTSNPVPVAGVSYSASATFTPAATSHVAGDVVGTAGTFALAAISGSRLKIVSATLEIDTATIETTAWRLHLFSVTPPSALADDAAFLLAAGDRASYLGYIDFAQVLDLGDTLYIEAVNLQKQIKLAGTGVFGYLVNGTTLTPAAVAHIVTLHAVAA